MIPTNRTPQARRTGSGAQRVGADQAAAVVESGMLLDYCTSFNQPDVFDAALGRRMGDLRNLRIRACLSLRPRAVLEADPRGERVRWYNLHFSGYDRRHHDAGLVEYIPLHLGEIPDYYRRFFDQADVAIIKTCPMDPDGYFNFGASNLWHRALLERARIVIVEESAALPYVMGEATGIHVSEVDYVIQGDGAPVPELPNPPPCDVDRAVARLIAAEIEDGACLQVGIGAMPNSVCSLLCESDIRDLGIHTEMLTDGLVRLHETGRVTGARKKLHPGKVVATFAVGSSNMYKAIDRNSAYHFCPVEYTNMPHIIMQNDQVVSINNTTQIDLQGQAASESDGFRHISGTGGQLQFVRGAYASRGGKSFICLASTYDKRGERRSRIVPSLTKGNTVTTPRTDVMYVVTEYGIANLKGKSVPERARAMIGLAHPDFREGLERAAHEQRMIPRGVF